MTYEDLPHPFPFTCEYLPACTYTSTSSRRVIVEEVFGKRFKIRTIEAMIVPTRDRRLRLASGQVFHAAPHELDFSTAAACRERA